jgi:hypothetical protein
MKAKVVCRSCRREYEEREGDFPILYDWCGRCERDMLEHFEYQMTQKLIGKIRLVKGAKNA